MAVDAEGGICWLCKFRRDLLAVEVEGSVCCGRLRRDLLAV
jgi:hypothetical protein